MVLSKSLLVFIEKATATPIIIIAKLVNKFLITYVGKPGGNLRPEKIESPFLLPINQIAKIVITTRTITNTIKALFCTNFSVFSEIVILLVTCSGTLGVVAVSLETLILMVAHFNKNNFIKMDGTDPFYNLVTSYNFRSFYYKSILFNPKNYTQKITESDRILWSLIVAIFVTLIFGLIMKPYITYNYCSIPGWLAILGYRPTCGNVSSFLFYGCWIYSIFTLNSFID